MISKLPLWVAILATLVKCSSLALINEWVFFGGWMIAGMWFVSIGYAYQKNYDLPMVGPFDYKNGANQLGRSLAAFAMVAMFTIAAIVG